MPRKIRIEYAGAIYHVISNGDWREDICHDDVDRQDFLNTLAEAHGFGGNLHKSLVMR